MNSCPVRHETLVNAQQETYSSNERRTFAIMYPIPLVPLVTNATRPLTEDNVLISVEAIAAIRSGEPLIGI